MNPKELPEIDCTGFHCEPYELGKCSFFSPRSPEEHDRLNTLLNATGWEKSWDKKLVALLISRLKPGIKALTLPYAELIPIGVVAGSEDIIGAVELGQVSYNEKHEVGPCIRGESWRVRFRPENFQQIKQDLQNELKIRSLKLLQLRSDDAAFSGKTEDGDGPLLSFFRK